MKKNEIEKDLERSVVMILYDKGFRYIVRDDFFGLQATTNKPKRSGDIWINCGKVDWLNDDMFSSVKSLQEYPTQICQNGTMRLARVRKQKAVSVWN